VKLAQVILFVDDVGRMQTFYAQLGLQVVDGDVASGFLRLADPSGGAVLALHAARAAGPASPPRVDTWAKMCFHIDDVDVERARLIERGITVRDIHRFGSIAFFDAIDPEGNIIQFTTR
jgi:catechol 2,3-dioxygenase-like lactoylglutathione lyase family enzyme